MQRQSGQRLYSATDLVAVLEGEHLTRLDLQALDDPALAALRCAADESNELIARKGDQHERAYLELLRGQGCQVIDTASMNSRAGRPATMAKDRGDLIQIAAPDTRHSG
jgi:uncharacterized protein